MAKQKNIPALRFPEFKDEWLPKKVGNITNRISNPVSVNLNELYQQIGIRSHGKGIFHKEFVDGKSLGNKRIFWLVEDALIVNIVFAWEHAVARTTKNEVGMVASHRFPMYVAIPNITDIDYLIHFFLTKKGKNLLELASPGGAGRNKTLGQKEFENLNFSIPSYAEQTKIALFLTTLNNKLQQLKKKKELLEQYKKGVMQQIFYQELRFKNDKGKDYADWENKTLGDVLDYVQPTKYLVSSKEYSNKYKTPVLTAGKTFILGYTNETKNIFNENLPVIIFDDFTTATQFVDFPFKAKSSAMKILVAKDSVNIKFIYEAMQMLRYEIGGHERHWISKYSPLEFDLPCPEEQTKIANFLSSIDDKINAVKQQIEKTQVWKNGLLQKMFV
jgi:type I restriction enzyme S subunit